jgi:hypothetical protein
MAGIFTTPLKKQIIDDLIDDINDSANNYFIGIGRSEQWDDSDTVASITNSAREIRNARLSLQALKQVEAISYVVPRYNWASGTIYSSYDDARAIYPSNPFYVLNSQNAVYICLQQAKNAAGASVVSTIEPTDTGTDAFTTADGYVWKYLYSLPASRINNFLTANWIPVKLITSTDSDTPGQEIEQLAVQNAAVAGQITSIAVTNGGLGYDSATPTVTITGDGDSATATATISGGSVVKIEMDNDSAAMGSGYHYASAKLSGGNPSSVAELRTILSPASGIGADPRDDLMATTLMFNIKPNGSESGKFLVDQDFRQIVLVRKPTKATSDSDYTGTVATTLQKLTFSSVATNFTKNRTIVGGTSGARAIVDDFSTDSDLLRYHQTETTGFGTFITGETLTESDGNGSGVIDSADSAGDINLFSGNVLLVENRAAIQRASNQTDDIKVLIQL